MESLFSQEREDAVSKFAVRWPQELERAEARLVEHRPQFREGLEALEAVVVTHAGFADATHLQGGVTAWAHQVEPSLPVY